MKKERILFWVIILLASACVLAASWKVPGFSDGYVKYVFPLWVGSYGRLTGLLPISVGEIMLYAVAFYVALTVLVLIIRFVLAVNGKSFLKKFTKVNMLLFIKLLILVAFIQVLNCFALYHTTTLYTGTDLETVSFTYEDLFALREKLVIEANAIAPNLTRDEKGDLVYEGNLTEIAVDAMTKLGKKASAKVDAGEASYIYEELTRLDGYYSKPKPLYTSKFFSQQNMAGYYFPFSLEANYNNLMYISNFPSTMCHELSHLRGFILEDEASFISYLACTGSDNQFCYYSGILDALTYVNNECTKALAKDPSLIGLVLTGRSDLVKHDMIFLTDEVRALIEDTAVIKTETVQAASDAFVSTNLTLNGVEDGLESYGRMVDLLLRYNRSLEGTK